MANTEQAMITADIRMLKKHEKEQDKRIENLELKESVNGSTILKAISNLEKRTNEEMQAIHEDNKSIHEELQALREDNKSIHEELQSMNGKIDLIIDLITKKRLNSNYN